MAKTQRPKHVWVKCPDCGGKDRKHVVLHKHDKYIQNDDELYSRHALLIQCGGCESVKMWKYEFDESDYRASREEFGCDPTPYGGKVYPTDDSAPINRKQSITGLLENDYFLIPADVHKMYVETVKAFDARIFTLASVGIRATIEAICVHLGMETYRLDSKIKELVTKHFLAQPQADLLHEGQFLGNEAAHELATPKPQDLEDGLQIIESMINLIYVVPEKAKRLKARREKREAARSVTATGTDAEANNTATARDTSTPDVVT